MLFLFRMAILFVLMGCGLQAAIAHPHVWIDAKADLLVDANNRFIAIRHKWTFDEAFATYATQGLDKNGDGVFSRKELSELARINMESLDAYQYFTFVNAGGDKVASLAGADYWLEYESGKLTLFYEIPMAEPVTPDPETGLHDLTINVYDPDFFVAIEFSDENPVGVSGPGAAGCTAHLKRPESLAPAQSQLLAQIGPTEEVPDELAPEANFLANTITVTCPTT